MPWKREGKCNQCGECCKQEMQYKPMLNKDGFCMYLLPSGKCKIQISIDGVPKAHLEYWKKECALYPDPNNPAHTPDRRHVLVEGCGFRIYWSDD